MDGSYHLVPCLVGFESMGLFESPLLTVALHTGREEEISVADRGVGESLPGNDNPCWKNTEAGGASGGMGSRP